MNKLAFEELRAANVARCNIWHNGFPGDEEWNAADWSNAMGGEAGEVAEAIELLLLTVHFSNVTGKAQDVVKKLRREDEGFVGNTKTREELLADVAKELADVVCYADLLACKLGIDLGESIVSKFNEVSDRNGFVIKLGESE